MPDRTLTSSFSEILVNIGLINGLLPDGTKSLHEPMLIYSQLSRRNKIRWKLNQNAIIYIHKNAFDTV